MRPQSTKIVIFIYPTRWNFAKMFSTKKNKMIGLPYAEESMMIGSAFSIQYWNVTDRQTDRQMDGQNCYVSVVQC